MTAAQPSVLNSTPPPTRQQDELLGFLLDFVIEATAAGCASFQIPDGEFLRVALSRGPNAPAAGVLTPMAGSVAGECWYRGKLVNGQEAPHGDPQSTLWTEEQRVEVMAVPVLRSGQLFGVLVLHHRHPGHFRRKDCATLNRLADLVAGLWSALSGPDSERRARLEVQAAARLALIATSGMDEVEVWEEIARTAAALLEAHSVRVATLDGNEMVCRAATGRFQTDVGRRRPARAGLDGLAAERMDGLLVAEWPAKPGNPPAHAWIQSVLAVPIRRVETVLGTITVADELAGRFSAADREALLRFGLHAAAALTEGRLSREEARRLEENRIAAAAASALAAAGDTPSLRRAIVEELRIAIGADGARLTEVIQEQWAVTATEGDAPFIEMPPLPGRQLLCGHGLGEDEATHRCSLPGGSGYLLAAELGHGAQNQGLLQLVRRPVFGSHDEQFLGRLADIAAVALVTRLAHIRLSQYADRIRSVAQVSATLYQASSSIDALRQAAEILQRALNVDSLCIALVDDVRQEVTFPVCRLSGEVLDGDRRGFERGFIEYVWRSGVTTFIPRDATHELERRGLTIAGRPRTLAAVPLRTRGAISGVVSIQDGRRDAAFEEEDVRILEIIVQQLAVTLEKIETFEEERRQRITAEWLRQIARAATDHAASPPQILEMAADAAFQGISGGAAMVSLLAGDGTMRTIGVRGQSPAPGDDGSESVDGSIAGWVVRQQGAIFLSSNLGTDERIEPAYAARVGERAVAAVPVWGEGRIVAVLWLAREIGAIFGVNEVERLAQVADHAGAGYQTARSTEALRRSEDRYRKLISTATDAIFTLDRGGKVLSFNEAAERLWGAAAADVLGDGWEVALPFDQPGAVEEHIRLALSGQSTSFESLVRRRDGERRTVAISVSPLVEAGETVAVLAIVRDVTDQRRVQAQLLQAEKMSAIGQLVGGMAHEINNPLASILVNMELLLSESKDPSQLDTLQAIKTETDRAAVIVRNLLTYVRGQGSERSVVDLRETLRSAVQLRRYQLLNQQIEVSLGLDPDPILVWGNNINLQQVLVNLLVNAEHAIRNGAGSGHVSIKGGRVGSRVLVTVEDNGPGIPPELLTRIFDPFFTTKPEGEGTGLGLSVSAGIVADHHGRLYAERRPGGGARFVVELPLHEASAEPEPERKKVFPPAAAPQAGKRVLLVDDEPDIRRSISKFLTRSGWEVFLADSGQEGLRLLEAGNFDVVLCDLRMPGMSGHELYRHLQARRSPLIQRLVFMTGDVVSPEAQNFLSEASRPVLSKPFGLQELSDVLQQVVKA